MIELRFGLSGAQPCTLEEVGSAFGVTRERIRQIENNTLKRLESLPEAQGLRDANWPASSISARPYGTNSWQCGHLKPGARFRPSAPPECFLQWGQTTSQVGRTVMAARGAG